MPIPSIRQDVIDGALGLSANANDYHVKIGICTGGDANAIYTFSDPGALRDALGTGPLVEAAAYHIGTAKRPVICIPASKTSDGALGTITAVGTSPAVTDSSSKPLDAYELIIQVTVAGAIGTSRVIYSLDGGDTWSLEVATAATLTLPGTGIKVAMASGSYVVGDTYAATCTAPAYDVTAATAAVEAALASGSTFRLIHIVGETASGAAAATLTAALQTLMTTAEGKFRYIYAVQDATDTDANLKTAYASMNAPRVIVCAGAGELDSFVTPGRAYKRPASWPFVARVMAVPIHEHPGRLARKQLGGVTKLYRDEYLTEGLDEARFTTLRSWVDEPGFYVTRGKTMAPLGSDFDSVMNRQVMDLTLATAYRAMLLYQNETLEVNADGTISEVEAAAMEKTVLAKLRKELLGEDAHASDVAFEIIRTNNVLTTKKFKYKVRVRPKGYAEFIEGEVGFSSPFSN